MVFNHSACIQLPTSRSSHSEKDSRFPTSESKQIQRNTDDIKCTRDRFPETKDHNSRNASPYGQLKEAEELGEVMETRKRVLGVEHPDTLATMHNLALTYRKQKRWNEAEELVVQMMETRKRVLGAEHPSTLATMHNLASTYRKQERWKEAEELEVQVMETRKRVLGAEHPDTLATMHNLAFTFKSQSRDHEAISLIEN